MKLHLEVLSVNCQRFCSNLNVTSKNDNGGCNLVIANNSYQANCYEWFRYLWKECIDLPLIVWVTCQWKTQGLFLWQTHDCKDTNSTKHLRAHTSNLEIFSPYFHPIRSYFCSSKKHCRAVCHPPGCVFPIRLCAISLGSTLLLPLN